MGEEGPRKVGRGRTGRRYRRRAPARRGAHRALREQAGLSQRELAGRLGVSQPRIAAIERSKNVTVELLEQYVAAVGGRLELTVVKGSTRINLVSAGKRGSTSASARQEDAHEKGQPPVAREGLKNPGVAESEDLTRRRFGMPDSPSSGERVSAGMMLVRLFCSV